LERDEITFGDNESSKHKNQKQGEGTQRTSDNLCSSKSSNEPKEGQCHLMCAKACQELSEKPEVIWEEMCQ